MCLIRAGPCSRRQLQRHGREADHQARRLRRAVGAAVGAGLLPPGEQRAWRRVVRRLVEKRDYRPIESQLIPRHLERCSLLLGGSSKPHEELRSCSRPARSQRSCVGRGARQACVVPRRHAAAFNTKVLQHRRHRGLYQLLPGVQQPLPHLRARRGRQVHRRRPAQPGLPAGALRGADDVLRARELGGGLLVVLRADRHAVRVGHVLPVVHPPRRGLVPHVRRRRRQVQGRPRPVGTRVPASPSRREGLLATASASRAGRLFYMARGCAPLHASSRP